MLPLTPIKLLPGDRVMRFKEVVALLGLCKTSVYSLIKTEKFPARSSYRSPDVLLDGLHRKCSRT